MIRNSLNKKNHVPYSIVEQQQQQQQQPNNSMQLDSESPLNMEKLDTLDVNFKKRLEATIPRDPITERQRMMIGVYNHRNETRGI